MQKNKNPFNNANTEITTTPGKTNPVNDGVKNVGNQQNLAAKVNMPRGAKKPRNTPK